MTDFTTKLPRNLYRATQVQALDRIAIEEFGIAGFQLMQVAGAVAFNQLLEAWPQVQHLRIFVGSGNNGGDGYIVAALAREHGLGVELIAVADPQQLKGDARSAWQWAGERAVQVIAYADFLAEAHPTHLHTVIVDALLGAIANGDIGSHFPPSEPQWKGASSDRFVSHAAKLVGEAGYRVGNIDLTIICEAPKIGPHREAMRTRIADLLGVDIAAISVKATTTERLGFTGRGEGIAAQAVATVVLG